MKFGPICTAVCSCVLRTCIRHKTLNLHAIRNFYFSYSASALIFAGSRKEKRLEYLILLIDDDPDEHLIISEAFKKISESIRIVAFESGESVLKQMAGDEMVAADFILLDINMPRLDGFSVLKHLKSDSRTKKIPVYMFSTSSDPADKHKSKKLGAAGYYSKPGTLDGYAQMVTSIISLHIHADKCD
jgi:CheY-like chemotaxis protein